MPREIKAPLTATKKRFGIVLSRFNEFVTSKLLEGALDCLLRHGADSEQIEIIWVPGAFEIPPVAQRMANNKKYDAILCLGAVIRGDTPHFDYIASEVTKGIARTALQATRPVVYGVITTDTLEQAIERAGSKAGNKGWEAALTAIELVNLYPQL